MGFFGIGLFMEAIKNKVIFITLFVIVSLFVTVCILGYINGSLKTDIVNLELKVKTTETQCDLDKEKIKSGMLEQINIKYEEGLKAGQVNAAKNTSIYNKKPNELKSNKDAVNKAKQEQKFDAIWLRIGTILTTNY